MAHTHAFATHRAREVKQPLSHLERDHNAARLHNAGGIREDKLKHSAVARHYT